MFVVRGFFKLKKKRAQYEMFKKKKKYSCWHSFNDGFCEVQEFNDCLSLYIVNIFDFSKMILYRARE